jgi:hypothetical protein
MGSIRALIEGVQGILMEKKLRANPKHAMDPNKRIEKLFQHIAEHPSVPSYGGFDSRENFLDALARISGNSKLDDGQKHRQIDSNEKDFSDMTRRFEKVNGKPDKVDRLRAKLWAKTVGLTDLDARRKKIAKDDADTADLAKSYGRDAAIAKQRIPASEREDLAAVSAKHRELGAGGGHVGGQKIFTGKKAALDKLKVGGPMRKSRDVGGEATMPGPGGADVAGKWVTSRGKRLFFPDAPGGDVPEGPWGGGPGRPGWKGRGGDWHPGNGVMPQKGQLSLFAKKGKQEGRTYGGQLLSEALAAVLAEYRTAGWSTEKTNKKGTTFKVTPPGKKGVWRTVGGKNVFFAKGEDEPWGGAPFRPGWTKRSGKFRPTAKRGVARPVAQKKRKRGKR